MRRFYLDAKYLSNEQFVISGDDFKHICGVCRMQEGAKFEILSGDHKAYFVVLNDIGKKNAIAKVLELREIKPIKKPYIHLFISLPKIAKFEWIIEKSVELGVYEISPFVSDYSFISNLHSPMLKKQGRWEKIVKSATQQSGRGDLMKINATQRMGQVLDYFNLSPNTMGLFAYEGDSKLKIQQALQSSAFKNCNEIALFIGSEGGFSRQEVKKFQDIGLEPVSLGDQVLRVETACVTLTSIIKYEMSLFD